MLGFLLVFPLQLEAIVLPMAWLLGESAGSFLVAIAIPIVVIAVAIIVVVGAFSRSFLVVLIESPVEPHCISLAGVGRIVPSLTHSRALL